MSAQLKVLHLNTAKRRQCSWSLVGDEEFPDLDLLSLLDTYVHEDSDTSRPVMRFT